MQCIFEYLQEITKGNRINNTAQEIMVSKWLKSYHAHVQLSGGAICIIFTFSKKSFNESLDFYNHS